MISAAGQMLNPSGLDWAVAITGPTVAVVLLVWSLWRPRKPRPPRRDRES